MGFLRQGTLSSIVLMQLALALSLKSLQVDAQTAQQDTPQLKTHSSGDSAVDSGLSGESVVLDVIVRSKAGEPISNLQGRDFILRDNKKQISPGDLKVSDSSTGNHPVQVFFVIDAVNSSLAELSKSEDSVESYLKAQTGHLRWPTTILVVSDSGTHNSSSQSPTANSTVEMHHRELFVHRVPASQDGSVLIQGLRAYKTGLHRILDAQGATGQGEKVHLSLEALSYIANAESSMPGAKLVIWISPGWPFLGRSEAKSSEQLFDSVIYFSNLLRTSRIILYSVSPQGVTAKNSSSPVADFYMASQSSSVKVMGHAPEIPTELSDTYYAEFLKGARTAKDSNPNDLALQVLAYQSGGLVLEKNNDLTGMIGRCVSDAETLYNLSYTPANNRGTDAYHELQVSLTKPSQPLRTRTGVYTK